MGLKLPLIKKQKIRNKKPSPVIEESVTMEDYVEEEPFLVLQQLMSKETKLVAAKEKLQAQLTSLRKKRFFKIQKKIQEKKRIIQKLRAEIKDLKFSCEELAKSLRHAHT